MQKYRCLWFYGITGIITGVAVFIMTSVRLLAAQVSGEEAFFTHIHKDSCYKTGTYSCESQHTCWSGYVEYKSLRCDACGTAVNHKVVCDSWHCSVKNLYWQINVVATCTGCGYVHPAWSNYNPAAHQQSARQLACGLTEGEATLGIRIIADASPTNSGVTLTISENVIKEDTLNGAITYDWGGNSRTVTENGTYSVTATNGVGQAATASVTISCIDKTAPVIHSITHDVSSLTQNSVRVLVSAGDAESGLADNAYSTDGGATWSAQSTFTVSEGKDVQLVIRDKAGNTVTQTIKRSAFPYPPKPTPVPTPVPTPKPVVTPQPTQQPVTQSGASVGTGDHGTGSAAQGKDMIPVNTGGEKDGTATGQSDFTGTKDETKDKKQDKVKDATDESHNTVATAEKDFELVEVEEEVPMISKPFPKAMDEAERYSLGLNSASESEDKGVKTAATGKNPLFVSENGTGQSVLGRMDDHSANSGTGSGSEGDGGLKEEGLHTVSVRTVLPVVGAVLTGLLAVVLLVGAGRFFWQNSAVLYCYDGGDEYRRLGLFFLRKKETDLELYLPEYLTETTDILRYRLLLKNGLVKKFAGSDLIVYSEDSELRRPLEECVDFVL